ncbi:MAG: Ig-like domain-containing protein [Marinicella sp.]
MTPDPAMTGATVTATCTGVETGATLTIPGYSCGVESNNEVICTGTVGVDNVDGDEVATVTDAAGNTNNADAFFTVDDTPPAAPVCTVTPDPAMTGATVTATCTGVETGATLTIPGYSCGVESNNEVICTGTVGVDNVDGDEVATVTDAAGNTNNADAFFTVDDTPPAAPVCTVTPDPAMTGATVTATCTGVETGATLTIPGYSCGVESNNEVICTGTVGVDNVDGDEVATVTDAAGNTNNADAFFTVDDTPPAAPTINSPTSGLLVSGTGEVGETVTVTTDSGASCSAIVDSNGDWFCTLSPEPVDGEDANAVQTDAAGNMSAPATAVVAYNPNLMAFITNCVAGVAPNETMLYEINIVNLGNVDIIGANVTTLMGTSMSTPTWECQTINGASCDHLTGTNDLNEAVDLPVGSELVYTLEADVTGSLMDFIDVEAAVTLPNGTTDTDTSNNIAFDSDLIYQFIFKNGFECAAPGSIMSTQKLLDSLSQ